MRAYEKAMDRWDKVEKMKNRREKQILDHIWAVVDVMTAILLAMLITVAFTVDAFGESTIPGWFYLIGGIYLIAYIIICIKRFSKNERREQ